MQTWQRARSADDSEKLRDWLMHSGRPSGSNLAYSG